MMDGTRPHSLAEIFCTLTKGVKFRYSPDDARQMVHDLASDLVFIELTRDDALHAIAQCEDLGIRGARIHDLMHAAAAKKFGATHLLTLDTSGFRHLRTDLTVQPPVNLEAE